MSWRRSTRFAVCSVALLAAGCGTKSPAISVTPRTSASDEPVEIVASHLPRRATVSVRVTSTDAEHVIWTNVSKLRTDAHGTATVPSRVVADMQPAGARGTYYWWPANEAARFRVSVSYGDKTRASVEFERTALAQPVSDRPVTLLREGIAGRYFTPSRTNGAQPGLLLFGGSEGGLAPYGLELARVISGHGIRVLDIAYWSYPGLPSKLDRIPLEYFAGALRWLARQPHVDARRLTVEGISYGSEAALLLGVHYPRLVHAVVASVPSNLASECYGGTCNGTDPAWTYRGRGITPFSPIPVERIEGPILAICGTNDLIWPSCPQSQAILARRRAHHIRFADRMVAARGAGHFVGATIPYQLFRFDPTFIQHAQDESGAEIAWPRLIAFLRRG